jgi:phosphosulfolactate phosphohydrolase-like enzyme
MASRGLAREVEFACRLDAFPVLPVLDGGKLRLAG